MIDQEHLQAVLTSNKRVCVIAPRRAGKTHALARTMERVMRERPDLELRLETLTLDQKREFYRQHPHLQSPAGAKAGECALFIDEALFWARLDLLALMGQQNWSLVYIFATIPMNGIQGSISHQDLLQGGFLVLDAPMRQ
jgi:hypothetical protein